MTARERKQFWIKERNKAARIIKRYNRAFYSDLRADLNLFAEAVERGQGEGYAQSFLFSQRVFQTMRQLYGTIGVRYARQAFNDRTTVKALTTGPGIQEWIDLILEYLGNEFYNRGVLKISNTTKMMMLDIINKGFAEGWGALKTADYIRNNPEIDLQLRNRAEMIARTETGRAIHSGTFVGADKSPFVKVKEWISARDSRTRGNPFNDRDANATLKKRPDHWDLDGVIVEFTEKFTDPRSLRQLLHPHDPKGGAADTINCRCSYAILTKKDERGKPIRKQTVDRVF
jgi:hypothetical protein